MYYTVTVLYRDPLYGVVSHTAYSVAVFSAMHAHTARVIRIQAANICTYMMTI
jgi:hypothetical protein